MDRLLADGPETSAGDVERAVSLLHESHHLSGADEPTALEAVWREKARLGWTTDAIQPVTRLEERQRMDESRRPGAVSLRG